jgi:dTDP-4-amino-4,6-dideoxygalactose transaminase
VENDRQPLPVPFINLAAQHQPLKKQILDAWGEIIDTSRFILGAHNAWLEGAVAEYCKVPHAIALNSGTDALILALRALDIGPGDEVLVPDFSFIASASAVALVGAKPVLVDIEPATFHMDLEQAAKRVNRRTKALIAVHLYGQAMNMHQVKAFCRSHRLRIVEDAAQALGAHWQGQPVGSLGDLACISFFPTKNFGALGDGGMVTTAKSALARRVRRLRDHGSEVKYRHLEVGYNSRLDELQAAALRIKWPYFTQWNNRRAAIAERYRQEITAPQVIHPEVQAGADHVYHQYTIRAKRRDALQAALRQSGIQTAVHYPIPLHQQPTLRSTISAKHTFKESTRACREILCLPIHPELTEEQIGWIVDRVNRFYTQPTP